MLEVDGNNSKVVMTNADGTRVESKQEVPKDFPIALMLSWTDRTAVAPG